MTFGSISSTLPATIVEKFAEAFRRLDGYRILWRLNNESLHNVELPHNVMIRPWLPQNDLLANPSIKLFIGHGGNSGQFEAIYHAVPIISFPIHFMLDQVRNAHILAHKGYGLSMDLHDFTPDQLVDGVRRITEDKLYKQRVTKASEIFRSQAQSPVERAAFWIEHVCRFGDDHLSSAGHDLPLYSYFMLDVLAVIVITIIIVFYLFVKLLMVIGRRMCGKRQIKDVKKRD